MLEYTESRTSARFYVRQGSFHHPRLNERGLFKMIWNRGGPVEMVVDGIPMTLEGDEFISLTPNQHIELRSKPSEEVIFYIFNREFYCILDNDHEVSCAGYLFYGSNVIPKVSLDEENKRRFEALYKVFLDELGLRDKVQGEMLRMLLKRLIIINTRIAKKQYPVPVDDIQYELIRHFNVEVEKHFRTRHKVSDYSELLHKSAKTLSNIFARNGQKSPSRIIGDRIVLEAKRLILYSDHSLKEIAYELGFDDPAHFSRFFKNLEGISPSDFKNRGNR